MRIVLVHPNYHIPDSKSMNLYLYHNCLYLSTQYSLYFLSQFLEQ